MNELLELIERLGTENPPSSEELSEARTSLVELLRTATASDTRDLESAQAIRQAIDDIDSELTSRDEAAQREEEEARRLLEGLEEPPAEEPAADPEGEPAADADAEDRELEPVAATTPPRRNLRKALRTTSARVTREEPAGSAYARVLTLGAAQSERLTADATMTDVARIFSDAAPRVKGRGDRQSLVRVEQVYPDNRQLFGSVREDNDRILDGLLAEPAIAAAGGICDPLPADFAHPILGNRGRPIRNALPRFQAARGGVRYSPTATLADLAGSVGVWTYETDTSPGATEKLCLVLECEEEQVANVDAITACLQIGNFQARFNSEFWRSRLDLLMVAHDRLAEQTLYAQMDAAATQVTYGAGSGTIYTVLSAIDKSVAGLRSRHRYIGQIRTLAPDWVHQALRADIASQRLGSSPAEALGAADRIIDKFFADRGVTPVWSLDLDVYGAQAAGALLDFPGADVEILIWPEGTYFFLDGGTLDLGTEIIDSTLVRQNNRMAFLETFEQAVLRGGEALAVTVPVDELCVCPSVVAA